MTRYMEFAKCIAVLAKLYRMGMVSEQEYLRVKDKIKSRFLIGDDEKDAA